MKERKTFIGMALVIAILILGVGYAAISNVNLTINGTANVTANADFEVAFDQEHTVVVDGATGSYTGELTADMIVNLDSSHKIQTAVYKIDNNSTELSATLAVEVKNNSETLNKYVTIASELYSDEACQTAVTGKVAKGTSAYVKVTATLENNPAQDVTNEKFTITVTATPADAN